LEGRVQRSRLLGLGQLPCIPPSRDVTEIRVLISLYQRLGRQPQPAGTFEGGGCFGPVA